METAKRSVVTQKHNAEHTMLPGLETVTFKPLMMAWLCWPEGEKATFYIYGKVNLFSFAELKDGIPSLFLPCPQQC